MTVFSISCFLISLLCAFYFFGHAGEIASRHAVRSARSVKAVGGVFALLSAGFLMLTFMTVIMR